MDTARAIVAALLVLVLPGYALVAAVFPQRTLADAERLLFSLGLSLAVAILGGLVLDALPAGLQPGWWLALLLATTLSAGAVALLRRRGASLPDLSSVGQSRARLPASQALLLAAAGLLAATAVVVAARGATEQPFAGVTELWMLPLGSVDQPAVVLGVRSVESSPTRYRLVLSVAGQVANEWTSIELAPGQTWETTSGLPTAAAANVVALLYRVDDAATIYRRVALRGSP